MTDFTTIIEQYGEQAEKTGWTYIPIPQHVADAIKPGVKTAYRVRGFLDNVAISGVSMLPVGEGAFIIPLNAALRRKTGKRKGAPMRVRLEEDTTFRFEIPAELQDLLDQDDAAEAYFQSLAPSHRNYFLKWYQDAKTAATRLDRLTRIYDALQRKWDYGLMIRRGKPRAGET